MATSDDPVTSALQAVLNDLASPGARRTYLTDWTRFTEWLTGQNLTALDVTARIVREHVVWMRDERKLARPTISKAISVIREVYRALVNDEVMENNPARETKTPKVDTTPKSTWMSGTQFKSLLDAMPNKTWRERRDRLCIRALISLGWRRAEIARMRMDDIDGGAIRVVVKGDKTASVGVPPRLMAEIKEWCHYAGIEDGPIFPLSQDKLEEPITVDMVYGMVKRASLHVGLKGISPHSFRRSMITYLKNAGVDAADLQAAVRHESIATTERYIKANKAAQQSPGEKVLEMLDGDEDL